MTAGALPQPGSVIGYADLWADEHASGAEEGRKDRPVLVLAIAAVGEEGELQVLALAVTHTPPSATDTAVPFPIQEKRRIGLDDDESWIVTSEGNAFLWPGPDLRPVPGRRPATPIYGTVSRALLQRVARSYLANRQKQRARLVPRTD